jgi:excisionase family DNA binding protein
MTSELLTTKEIEHIIQLNRVTIYRLIREEGFPAVKIGNQWRFPRTKVHAWLEKHGYATEGIASFKADNVHNMPTSSWYDEQSSSTTLYAEDTETDYVEHLFDCIEITSLLNTFSVSLNLSVSVIASDGKTIIDCPNCRHPFCQYVREHDGGQCLLSFDDVPVATPNANSLTEQITHVSDLVNQTQNMVLLHCSAGLQYLRAPLQLDNQVIAYLLLGPIVMDDGHETDIYAQLDAFAKATGSDQRILRQHYRDVEHFTVTQIRVLVKLLSQVLSTMLGVVDKRLRAVRKLDKIAELASASST